MSDGGDCRTAPATPGLLKTVSAQRHSADIKKPGLSTLDNTYRTVV